jgi:hypothetical protein
MNEIYNNKNDTNIVIENENKKQNLNKKIKKTSNLREILSNHTNNGHDSYKANKEFTCLSCNYTFTRKSNFKRHMLKNHMNNGNQPILFDNIEIQKQGAKKILNEQIQEQHEYKCDICNNNQINNIFLMNYFLFYLFHFLSIFIFMYFYLAKIHK